MPRGRKKSPLQTWKEQISKIDDEIAKHEDKIKQLESRKKELLDLKKKQELNELYTKIKESGKTVDEVLKLLDEP